MRRIVYTVLLASMALGSILAGQPVQAASPTKTYNNTRYGISLKYPAGWVAQLHVKGVGIAGTLAASEDGLLAPDGNIGVAILVQTHRLSAAARKATALKLFRDGEKVVGPLSTGTMTIGHTTFLRLSGTTRDEVGTQTEVLLVGDEAQGTYYFGGVVDGTVKDQAAAMATLQGVFRSITIR